MNNGSEVLSRDWVARVGLLLPPPNTVMEREFNAFLPAGVTAHATRVFRSSSKVTEETMREMESNVETASNLLAMADIDIMVFGCTAGSLVGGLGWDRRIIKKIKDSCGVNAITTSTAVVKALKTVGKSVVVLAPYTKELTLKECSFFEAHEIEVKAFRALGILNGNENSRLLPEKLIDEVLDLESQSNADAVFLSCTNVRTFEIIDSLEKKINKPIISSNLASLWLVLKELNLHVTPKCGRLFREYM